MPRQARLDAPGTLHLVMIRGVERSPIFKDDQDRQNFISRGGVCDPLDREIERVRLDALNEYISIQAARDLYGVVIDPKKFEVDDKATKALRAKLKGEKRDM